MPLFLSLRVVVESPTKDLHAEKSEDHDEQEEKEKQGEDGLDRVEKGVHEIGERTPISVN